MKKIIIASKNEHKVREINQVLKELDFEADSLLSYPDYKSPEETGTTFLENAHIKADALYKFFPHSPRYILADDSGISCDGLGGLPGVHSARFASPNAKDSDNNKKLVDELSKDKSLSRAAHYTCAMILIEPNGNKTEIEETCHGHIVFEPKGKNGFGYDPYFFLQDYNKTMAEISPEEKNKISHRGKALRKLFTILRSFVQ